VEYRVTDFCIVNESAESPFFGRMVDPSNLKGTEKNSLPRHSVPDRLYDMSRHACDLKQQVTACPARVDIADSIFSIFWKEIVYEILSRAPFKVLRCAEYR